MTPQATRHSQGEPHGRIRVDPGVRARFPAFRLCVLYAFGLENGPSDARSEAALEAACAPVQADFGAARLADHPHVTAWRAAYQAFGAKPSKYPSSVEALVQRVLKHGCSGVPRINRLVDIYNAVSIRHLLPIGGEDLDRLDGDLVLRSAVGTEPFDIPDSPGATCAFPAAGEVVWADDAGVTCRRWNWRQGRRTRLAESTVNGYFILEALSPPYSEEALQRAADELSELLRALGRAKRIVRVAIP